MGDIGVFTDQPSCQGLAHATLFLSPTLGCPGLTGWPTPVVFVLQSPPYPLSSILPAE